MQLQDWYRSVPVITRAYMTACVLTTLAVHLDLVSTFDLYLNYHAIFRHYEVRCPSANALCCLTMRACGSASCKGHLMLVGVAVGDQLPFLRPLWSELCIPYVLFVRTLS